MNLNENISPKIWHLFTILYGITFLGYNKFQARKCKRLALLLVRLLLWFNCLASSKPAKSMELTTCGSF